MNVTVNETANAGVPLFRVIDKVWGRSQFSQLAHVDSA